jgi:hypothetical protein
VKEAGYYPSSLCKYTSKQRSHEAYRHCVRRTTRRSTATTTTTQAIHRDKPRGFGAGFADDPLHFPPCFRGSVRDIRRRFRASKDDERCGRQTIRGAWTGRSPCDGFVRRRKLLCRGCCLERWARSLRPMASTSLPAVKCPLPPAAWTDQTPSPNMKARSTRVQRRILLRRVLLFCRRVRRWCLRGTGWNISGKWRWYKLGGRNSRQALVRELGEMNGRLRYE